MSAMRWNNAGPSFATFIQHTVKSCVSWEVNDQTLMIQSVKREKTTYVQ